MTIVNVPALYDKCKEILIHDEEHSLGLIEKEYRLEDAEAWVKKLDADYIAWKNAPKVENTMSAESYYSITGYYGD